MFRLKVQTNFREPTLYLQTIRQIDQLNVWTSVFMRRQEIQATTALRKEVECFPNAVLMVEI